MNERSIAMVNDCRSQVTETRQVSFPTLAAMFAEVVIGTKDGRAWMPANIAIGPRTADRVKSISYLALDVEAKTKKVGDVKTAVGPEPPDVDAMLLELTLHGWRCSLHTSYSHNAEHPRYRLIFDISRSLKVTELKLLGLHVAGLLGIGDCADTACLEPARLFFLPRCPDEASKKLYRCAVTAGVPLPVDALLVDAQRIEAASAAALSTHRPPATNSVIGAFNSAHDIRAVLAQHDYKPMSGNRWLCPGSTTGCPGVRLLPGGERVYSSHSGDPLNDDHAHDVFDCWRILQHGGDTKSAVKDTARLLGMEHSGAGIITSSDDLHGEGPEPFEVALPHTPWPEDCLPLGMQEAAKAIAEHVDAPVPLAGMAVVAAVAHIAQRLVDAKHPRADRIPASLFIITEGKSGDRKSACFKLATAPISKREREEREHHKAEIMALEREAALAKPKDRAAILGQASTDPRTIFTDSTTQKIEQVFINGSAPALSLSTDEGGTLLGGHSLKSETRAMSLSALTRLFDGSGVQRDRIGEGQSGFRFGIRFGLFLSAQPIVLREVLSDPLMRGQGFLPRFLYGAPKSLAGSRFLDLEDLLRQANDDLRITGYWYYLQKLDELPVITDDHGGLCLPMVGMDAEAVEEWLHLYNDTEIRQGKDGDLHELGAFASRAGELAARVATVYAVWRCCCDDGDMGATTVTGDDMQRAAALVGYSLAEWQRQGAGAILSSAARDARDLLEWLHRKGLESVTRSYIAQHCPGGLRKDKVRRDTAINELIRRRWLVNSDGKLAIIRKQEAPPATATSATSATCVLGDKSSKSSRNSSSNPAPVFFNPEPSHRMPARVVDVADSIAALLGKPAKPAQTAKAKRYRKVKNGE